MPEAKIVPFTTDGSIYRYERNSWLQAGTDDFTLPPAQNSDSFLQLNNILPPATNVLLRRFGYRFFNPALDNGANIDSDEFPVGKMIGIKFAGSLGMMETSTSFTFASSPTYSFEGWFETSSTLGSFIASIQTHATPVVGETEPLLGVYLDSNGKVGANIYNGTTNAPSTPTTLSYNDGALHQVVVTWTSSPSGSIKVYVDGALQTTTAFTTNSNLGPSFWRIGHGCTGQSAVPPTKNAFNGFISHCSAWMSTALTGTQVLAHYNAFISGTQSTYETAVLADSPTYSWFMTETSGTSIADHAGANTGTLTQVPNPTSILNTTFGNVSTITKTINVTGAPYNVGDTGFFLIALDPQSGPVSITSVTDSLGNTYNRLLGPITFSNAGGRQESVNVFTTTVAIGSAAGTSFTLTANFNNNAVGDGFSFASMSALGTLDQSNHAQGSTGTTYSSGGITIASTEMIIATGGSQGTQSAYPFSGLFFIGNNGGDNSACVASIQNAGALTDTWTQGSSLPWCAAIDSFGLVTPWKVGQRS